MTQLDQLKKLARGRGQDKRGRSRRGERHVRLYHWLLNTQAWRALTPAARAVYIELEQRYHGANNGEVSLSVREVAELVHIAKDTASKTLHELECKGFIRRNVCGSFAWKLRHATTWILTTHELGHKPATKEFARWTPPNAEPGPNSGTDCPNPRTLRLRFDQYWAGSILNLGL